jgi:hypothetical protein
MNKCGLRFGSLKDGTFALLLAMVEISIVRLPVVSLCDKLVLGLRSEAPAGLSHPVIVRDVTKSIWFQEIVRQSALEIVEVKRGDFSKEATKRCHRRNR